VSAAAPASAYETLQGLVGPTVLPGPRRGRRLVRAAVAGLLVLVLGAGGTVGWRWWQLREARTGYLLAIEALSAALAGAHLEAERAREVLDSVGEQVLDADLTVDLAGLVDHVAAGRAEVVASQRLGSWPRERVVSITAALRSEAREARELREQLQLTRDSLTASHHDWLVAAALERVSKAGEDLTSAVEQATTLLADTEDRVQDPVVRDELAAAIEHGAALLTAGVEPGTALEALEAAAADLGTARERVHAAAAAVSESHEAWQAAQAPPASTGTGSGSTGGSSAGQGSGRSGGSTSGGGGASGSAGPTAPGGSTGAGGESGGSGGSTQRVLNPGRAVSDGTPGKVTVTATTSWAAASVTATVAGVTLPMVSTGTGSYSATFTGLPAGDHSWSVTADGLTAHGSKATVF